MFIAYTPSPNARKLESIALHLASPPSLPPLTVGVLRFVCAPPCRTVPCFPLIGTRWQITLPWSQCRSIDSRPSRLYLTLYDSKFWPVISLFWCMGSRPFALDGKKPPQ